MNLQFWGPNLQVFGDFFFKHFRFAWFRGWKVCTTTTRIHQFVNRIDKFEQESKNEMNCGSCIQMTSSWESLINCHHQNFLDAKTTKCNYPWCFAALKAFAAVFATFYPDSSAMNGVKVCEKKKDFLWKETCYSVRIILIGHLLFHLPDSKPGHIFLSPLVLKFVSVFVAVFEAFWKTIQDMVLVDQSSVRSRWLDIGQVLYSRMYGPKQSGRVHKKHF